MTSDNNLRDVDAQILDELHDGARTKGALVDAVNYSRNTVYNRLDAMEMAGYIRCVHDGTRLFELWHDPRDELDERPYVVVDLPDEPSELTGDLCCPACGEALCHLGCDTNPFTAGVFQFWNEPCCGARLDHHSLVFVPKSLEDTITQEELKQCVIDYHVDIYEDEGYDTSPAFSFIDRMGWDADAGFTKYQ